VIETGEWMPASEVPAGMSIRKGKQGTYGASEHIS
jgi:hypothetical protein